MPSNPKGSPWRNTPVAKRHRKPLMLSLKPETIAALREMATERGVKMSHVVEQLITEEFATTFAQAVRGHEPGELGLKKG